MKPIVLFALFIVAGCMVTTGCVTQPITDNDSENVTLSQTFTPFSVPGTEGPLTIFLGGLSGEYPVFVDNLSVGVVSQRKPITLKMHEGNYSVKVCCGKICEEENVAVRFGKQRTVDVSEQLRNDLGSSEPAVRIADYYPNGDQVTINVEFINPTTQPLAMSADVTYGYSYIESRSNQRVGNSPQGYLDTTVNACNRVTKTLNFNLASGSSYIYEIPVITRVSSK